MRWFYSADTVDAVQCSSALLCESGIKVLPFQCAGKNIPAISHEYVIWLQGVYLVGHGGELFAPLGKVQRVFTQKSVGIVPGNAQSVLHFS